MDETCPLCTGGGEGGGGRNDAVGDFTFCRPAFLRSGVQGAGSGEQAGRAHRVLELVEALHELHPREPPVLQPAPPPELPRRPLLVLELRPRLRAPPAVSHGRRAPGVTSHQGFEDRPAARGQQATQTSVARLNRRRARRSGVTQEGACESVRGPTSGPRAEPATRGRTRAGRGWALKQRSSASSHMPSSISRSASAASPWHRLSRRAAPTRSFHSSSTRARSASFSARTRRAATTLPRATRRHSKNLEGGVVSD